MYRDCGLCAIRSWRWEDAATIARHANNRKVWIHLQDASRSAEIGYWLGEEYWGRGIVTAALKGLTAYAVETLGICRVFALPFTDNPASCRVLEKAGYVREAVLRRSAVKDGEIKDQALYAFVVG